MIDSNRIFFARWKWKIYLEILNKYFILILKQLQARK